MKRLINAFATFMTTIIDIFRQEYTPVTEENKAKMLALKQKAQELWEMLGFDEATKRMPTREAALAATALEESVMWAVKGLTSIEANPKVEQPS